MMICSECKKREGMLETLRAEKDSLLALVGELERALRYYTRPSRAETALLLTPTQALERLEKRVRAEAFEEVARIGREDEILVGIAPQTAHETRRDWGIKVVEALCRTFVDKAAALRVE